MHDVKWKMENEKRKKKKEKTMLSHRMVFYPIGRQMRL